MRSGFRVRLAVLAGGVALLAGLAAGTASPADGLGSLFEPYFGHRTSAPSMLEPVAPGVRARPIITVGETLRNGYRFESIPDGIAIHRSKRQFLSVDVYVNHETSLVPFPVFPPTTFFDYTNAMVSKLTLSRLGGGVLDGSYAIPSEANYQRFCSNFLAGREHGFERELLLTNEEATDFVYRTGIAWPVNEPADPRVPEQAGVVVALDVATGEYRTIYGMGRHNHENSVALPGERPFVLSGDDTFSAPSSQLYAYTATSAAAVWNDEGTLWAFKSTDPAVNDYGDLGLGESVAGTFVAVPREIAVGDQAALERWSNENGVFQFIRLEDIAYDRSDPSRVYLADTGEPRAISNGATDPALQKLVRGPSGTMGPYPNGRIFVLELDDRGAAGTPAGARLSVLVDGDALPAGAIDAIHQPDNLETTKRSLLIQEDPGSQNQYALPAGEGKTSARIWRYDLASGDLEVVARVDQSQDTTGARLGAWESSGIIDASKAFGPGWFLVDVQAGTISLDRVEGPDEMGPPPPGSTTPGPPDGRPDTVLEREGGQLLLVKIPGA
jgi:hypothetical protein